MFRDPEIRTVFKDAVIICLVVLLSTFTRNWALLGISLFGVAVAASQKMGKSICVYFLISFLPGVNLMLMPRYGQYAVISRLSMIIITGALILGSRGRGGRHRIPLEPLFLYLAVALVSSMFGYFPIVSYLKIVNFLLFIVGIYIGTQNINRRIQDITMIRHMILAIILLFTYGSLVVLPFPSIAYFTSLQYILMEYGTAYANSYFNDASGIKLFSGVSAHSQLLGPTLACASGWLLCDMWFVKKRLSAFHLALLAPIPFICYMTRSRLALLVLVISLVTTTLFCMPKAKVSVKTKKTFYAMAILSTVLIIVFSAMAEVKNRSFSRWIRKTESSSDERSLSEAIKSSRMGAISLNMNDFYKNPLWGTGFQVSPDMRQRYAQGRVSLFSASIEKGLLPFMVLGETGLLGAIVFAIFLFNFYITCHRKNYLATATLFTLFLATNMAEASFFAPSGLGGILWTLAVVGGFVIDMQQYAETATPPVPIQDYEMMYYPDSDEQCFDGNDDSRIANGLCFPQPDIPEDERC